MKCYSYSMKGKRKTNEDKHLTCLNLSNINKKYNNIDLLAVFDGHGGDTVSNFLYDAFISTFFANKKIKYNDKMSDTLLVRSDAIAKKLKKTHPIDSYKCGSTMCCGIRISPDFVWILNCGDSRAVICNSTNKAISLSNDHKPNTETERKRIIDLGGIITKENGDDWRIKNLSVSRSYGDLDTSPYVTHTPDITLYNIKNCKFIIFACDGLWDVFNNDDAVKFVLKASDDNSSNSNIAKQLVEAAYDKGSTDNITAIIYFI